MEKRILEQKKLDEKERARKAKEDQLLKEKLEKE